jgi:hypothetical protein
VKPDLELLGSWSIYTPYDWNHDGKPVKTKHFTIYSDNAATIEREKISRGLEIFLQELNQLLNINENDAKWYPTQTNPFTVFLNKSHPEVPFGFAYPRGMIIVSPDAKFFRNLYPGYYGKFVTHELIHAIDMAITSDVPVPPPVWFREGFAQLCSGLSVNNKIQTIDQLNNTLEKLNLNKKDWTPLSIQQYLDYPKTVIVDKQEGIYYPLFELAVEYLFTETQTGNNITDIIGFLERLSITNTFHEEFERMFGFTMETYEKEFYIKISEWFQG